MGHWQTWYVNSTSCWVTLAVARSRHFCDGYGRKWMGPDYFRDTFRYLLISELRLETWRLYLAGSIIWSSYISCSAARPSGTFCEIKQPQLPGAWSAESKCFREGAQIFQIKKNAGHSLQAEMPYLCLDEEPEVLSNGMKGNFCSVNIHHKSIIQLRVFWLDLFPVA